MFKASLRHEDSLQDTPGRTRQYTPQAVKANLGPPNFKPERSREVLPERPYPAEAASRRSQRVKDFAAGRSGPEWVTR